ncbi:MAG: P-II family nitrogen regulator [Candidatus Omnitrophota bacterium]
MVKIEAVIRKEKFEEVYKALERSGIGGMTSYEVQGFGLGRGGLQAKHKIEIFADEFQAETIVELIRSHAVTGKMGDGKIAILNLENLIRIRTGEDGAAAL